MVVKLNAQAELSSLSYVINSEIILKIRIANCPVNIAYIKNMSTDFFRIGISRNDLAFAAGMRPKINNKKIILKKGDIDDTHKLSEILNNDCSDKKKLDLFLQYNRYFQFNGFISEQKAGVNIIESSGILSNDQLKQKYLSDLCLVYFKDFFFEESKQKLRELELHLKNNDPSAAAVNNILNIALFRCCFFKQRLAFGPFLAAGIMLSILWGEKFLDLYYKIMEKIFLG